MGNDLHRVAEVIPPPLLLDDRTIDLARRQVVRSDEALAEEALVVPQVEVGLRAVVEDENLTVLVRIHRASIDIQVGIDLEDRHGDPPRFQQATERGGRNSFSEAGNHAAAHHDNFHNELRAWYPDVCIKPLPAG